MDSVGDVRKEVQRNEYQQTRDLERRCQVTETTQMERNREASYRDDDDDEDRKSVV